MVDAGDGEDGAIYGVRYSVTGETERESADSEDLAWRKLAWNGRSALEKSDNAGTAVAVRGFHANNDDKRNPEAEERGHRDEEDRELAEIQQYLDNFRIEEHAEETSQLSSADDDNEDTATSAAAVTPKPPQGNLRALDLRRLARQRTSRASGARRAIPWRRSRKATLARRTGAPPPRAPAPAAPRAGAAGEAAPGPPRADALPSPCLRTARDVVRLGARRVRIGDTAAADERAAAPAVPAPDKVRSDGDPGNALPAMVFL